MKLKLPCFIIAPALGKQQQKIFFFASVIRWQMLLSNFPMQTSDRFRICLPPKVGAQTSFHECYIVLWLLLCFTIYYVSEMFRPVTCFRKLSVKCSTLYHKKPVMWSTLPSYVQNLIGLNLSGTHFPVFVHDRCGWMQQIKCSFRWGQALGCCLPLPATTLSIIMSTGKHSQCNSISPQLQPFL